MKCICGCRGELERIQLGLRVCKRCAHNGHGQSIRKGIMVYGHKTGAEIEILSEESWNDNKKYFIPNGARSAMKNFSRNICS